VTDQHLEYGEELEFQLSAFDLSGIDHWILNDTLNFDISLTGRITNKVDLKSGTYNLLVSVLDPYENILSAEFTVFVAEVVTTTTTSTTSTTTSTTTTTTSTNPPPVGIDPVMTLALGTAIGGIAAALIVVLFLRRKP